MSYEITWEVEKDYIKVCAAGEQTLEDNIKLVSFVIESCEKYGVGKVVVDIRGLKGQPGTTADFKLANIAVSEALGRIRKTAIINDEESLAYTAFFETAIRNRGINLYAFKNEAEAFEWISQG